jgi:DNA sulfur modification protein DndB
VVDILEFEILTSFSDKRRITRPDDELYRACDTAKTWWESVLEGITAYKQALEDLSRVPELRMPKMPQALLVKPIGQIVLFKGLVRALQRSKNKGACLTLEEAISRADRVDWAISSEMWSEILVRAKGTLAANRQTYALGADLLAYLIAPEYISDDQRKQLWTDYNKAKGIDVEDPKVKPVELPTPVTVRT